LPQSPPGSPPESEDIYGWSLNGRSWTLSRRADGIPVLDGATDSPSPVLIYFLLGMGAAVAAIPTLVWLLGADWLTTGFLIITCGTLSCLAAITVRRIAAVRRHLHSLRSTTDLAGRYGITPESLRAFASSHAIRPHFIVNEQEHFHPADFDSLATLLRPAESPPDILLRPAAPTASPESTLLLPSTAAGPEARYVL
jgi:hypothetical protein